jgi:hypothetical protein
MIPFMQKDEQQVLRSQDMSQEKRGSDPKFPLPEINDSCGDPFVKGNVPYEFEDLRRPFRTIAAGSPVTEHLVTGNCGDQQRGRLLQIIILQRLLNLLDSLG